ncbi:N-acetylmuramoyl-L-alanine amidase AmiD [Roseobacter fucihabitans]|uniref:N-acetylmuramoyl-L-alanine amidase n=1 Tax=Roseobacter fucihabitans TaxID=1537242 RepID=A0ABZ2BQ53_9RHOB|nr:N-acetylmuramoyl-L-alanine amidase [Roseobacter litoralis]MBC6967406.1 N-acetylmuramoyl-L-alanine amidase AmiD precursor [Roseobacter litoralis]
MRQHPSPNFGPRRDGLTPSIVVLHYTAMASSAAAIARLCDPKAQVSSHYVICRRGEAVQLVSEAQRAWHAGAGEWRGQGDINSRSIGIELDNAGDHPFPEPQMAALETLLADILSRWSIPPQNVIGHSDMAPGRKIDPGSRFDWARLARRKLAAQAGGGNRHQHPTAAQLRSLAVRTGYTADVDHTTLLAAIRLRFRPFATGPLEPEDIAVLGHNAPRT